MTAARSGSAPEGEGAAGPTGSDLTSAYLRTFTIQGSFNYRTLVGGGLGNAMLPLLRRIHAGDPVAMRAALERHTASFNGHPYLCPMAVTALARLEAEGVAPDTIQRFRTALRGPLGALGDRAVWAGWRPLCLLLAILAFGAGAGPLASGVLFLVLYNVGHLALRTWSFRRGWREGIGVGAVLSRSPFRRVGDALVLADQVLLGAAATLVFLETPTSEAAGAPALLAGLAAAMVGFLAPRAGRAGVLALFAAAALWLA